MSKIIKMVKSELRSLKRSKAEQRSKEIEWLRSIFKYRADGKPDVYSYGVFKAGITSTETKDYLQIYLGLEGKVLARALDKYWDEFGAQTCPCVSVNGQMITLYYRHDIERIADKVFQGKPTYFD